MTNGRTDEQADSRRCMLKRLKSVAAGMMCRPVSSATPDIICLYASMQVHWKAYEVKISGTCPRFPQPPLTPTVLRPLRRESGSREVNLKRRLPHQPLICLLWNAHLPVHQLLGNASSAKSSSIPTLTLIQRGTSSQEYVVWAVSKHTDMKQFRICFPNKAIRHKWLGGYLPRWLLFEPPAGVGSLCSTTAVWQV